MFNSSHKGKALENGAIDEKQNKQNEKQVTSGNEASSFIF